MEQAREKGVIKMVIRSLIELNEGFGGRLYITRRVHNNPYDGWTWEVDVEKRHIEFVYPWSTGKYFYNGIIGKTLLPVVSLLKEFGIVRNYKYHEDIVEDRGMIVEDNSYIEVEFEEGDFDLDKIPPTILKVV